MAVATGFLWEMLHHYCFVDVKWEKKRKAMSTVLRYTVGGEWGRLELVLLRYGEPFENSASPVAFASHIPPRNCGQKVPKHRKN